MATHCRNCGDRHFTGPAPTVDACPSCAPAFIYELTPIGEQAVIPGCERNSAPAKKQLDLFG